MEKRNIGLKKSKLVAALNIVSLVVLVLSVAVFILCVKLQIFVTENMDFGQGLGYALILVLGLPCLLIVSAVSLGADIYKVVFGSILLKANANVKENKSIEISPKHFRAAKSLGIVNIIMLLLSAFFAYVIADAAGNTAFDILFALWFILLAAIELVPLFAEGKVKKEIAEHNEEIQRAK
ncbi:MAG: hypothetical protein IKC35_02530 [Clostridia bacterium]|nr:hypothetical protein [Clostridia bacterium]